MRFEREEKGGEKPEIKFVFKLSPILNFCSQENCQQTNKKHATKIIEKVIDYTHGEGSIGKVSKCPSLYDRFSC